MALVVGALFPWALSGCFGGEDDIAAGQRIFRESGCAGCHTLSGAGATGKIGPNLDLLKPDSSKVVRQVTTGGGGMPSFGKKLSSKEILQVAGFVQRASRNPSAVVSAKFEPTKQKLSDCHGRSLQDIPCYEQALGNLTYYQGPKVGLATLQRTMNKNSGVLQNCHRIAHTMGGAGIARLKSTGKAIAEGSAVCWSGYYHGVIEKDFAGVKESQVVKRARDACADPFLKNRTFLLYQCVHGLGHGLMLYTNYDLPKSLELCTQLQTRWDQDSCVGGVFMENFMNFYGIKSKWVSRQNLLYPCNVVRKRFKYFCYYMVTSRINRIDGWRWRETARICRLAEPGWVGVCFESYGRDASGVAGTGRGSARYAREVCALALDHADSCVFAVARDIVNNDGGRLSRGVHWCNSNPKKLRNKCFMGIGTVIATLVPTKQAKVRTCDRVSGQYADECRYGAFFWSGVR